MLTPETTTRGQLPNQVRQATATGWMRWLPGLNTLRRYEPTWLKHDLVAGLVMTAMLVPVGIAYAQASGLPGITGLYATIVPVLAYAVFGPSPILILGPNSALAAVILSVVAPLSAGDSQRAVSIAGLMAIVSGTLCVAAGLARLGFITELLSKPIRYGYMNGIALTVLLSQIPKLCGFSVSAEGPLRQVWGIVQKVRAGNANLVTLVIGAGTLLLILLLKRWLRVPGILLAVVAATVVVAAFDLANRAGVSVLGPLPQGLPFPQIPFVHVNDLVPIMMGGAAVALVSFADTSVLSKTYAARLRVSVDSNQEVVGLGIANLAAGFFQGFPISSSSSRTPVAEAAGAKTQLTAVVGAVMIALLLVFAPQLEGSLLLPPPSDSVKDWPLIGAPLSRLWSAASNNLSETILKFAPQFKSALPGILLASANFGSTLLQFLLSILLSGVLLANAQAAYNVTRSLAIRLFGEEEGPEYQRLVGTTIRSVTFGVLGVALIQTAFAAAGFFFVGLPGASVWSVIFLAAAVVQIGMVVLAPAVIYVFAVASTTKAIIFLVWCLIVGLMDNVLKPILLGRGAAVPMIVVFLGVLGGFMAMGIVGLFVGAIVLSVGYKLFLAWIEGGITQVQQ